MLKYSVAKASESINFISKGKQLSLPSSAANDKPGLCCGDKVASVKRVAVNALEHLVQYNQGKF